jgi:excisionase family DNA binding protein
MANKQEDTRSPRMNAAEAAEFVGVAEKTIRKLTSEQRIPFIRISGRCVRYDRQALSNWLEARSVKPRGSK